MLIARKQSWLIVLAVVVVAVVAAMLVQTNAQRSTERTLNLQSATLYPEPRALAPFQLLADTGNAFGNAELMGHWSFVFFGFTQCPDICPTTLAVMAQVAKQLPAATRFIFVSVDPERDTPALLQDYVNWFNFGLTGVTGDVAGITALARDMGVAFSKVAQGETYVMDHSVRVFLIDPQGRRHAIFSPSLGLQGFDAETVVHDFVAILGSTEDFLVALPSYCERFDVQENEKLALQLNLGAMRALRDYGMDCDLAENSTEILRWAEMAAAHGDDQDKETFIKWREALK